MSGDNPLQRARVERGIELADIARRTCLSPQVVQKIDSGRFDELPAGVYARSYVRSFAVAVNLDPEVVVATIGDRLPSAEDPLPVMRDVEERKALRWMAPLVPLLQTILPTLREAAARVTGVKSRTRSSWAWAAGPFDWPRVPDALRRIPGPAPQWRGAVDPGSPGRRLAAIAMDAAVLVLLHVLLVHLTAWITGVSREHVLASAGVGVTAVWALLVVQYFLLLGGIAGRTPGAWLFGLRQPLRTPRAEPLGWRAILHRTVLY